MDQYIHRLLAEEDIKGPQERNDELFHVSVGAEEKLYQKGDFAASGLSSVDTYLIKKVAPGICHATRMVDLTKGANWIFFSRLACFQTF